jgi:hypothetical protein
MPANSKAPLSGALSGSRDFNALEFRTGVRTIFPNGLMNNLRLLGKFSLTPVRRAERFQFTNAVYRK